MEIPIKTVRSQNKFELLYLVRKHEKQGWTRGKFVKEYTWSGAEWRCYMRWEKGRLSDKGRIQAIRKTCDIAN